MVLLSSFEQRNTFSQSYATCFNRLLCLGSSPKFAAYIIGLLLHGLHYIERLAIHCARQQG